MIMEEKWPVLVRHERAAEWLRVWTDLGRGRAARVEPGRSGRYTPGRRFGGQQHGLVPTLTKLPWIPSETEWLAMLTAFRRESARNRLMLALAYDAALRREELSRRPQRCCRSSR
jgi:integrase